MIQIGWRLQLFWATDLETKMARNCVQDISMIPWLLLVTLLRNQLFLVLWFWHVLTWTYRFPKGLEGKKKNGKSILYRKPNHTSEPHNEHMFGALNETPPLKPWNLIPLEKTPAPWQTPTKHVPHQIPSLKPTASLPLKIKAWFTCSFPFGFFSPYFQGRELAAVQLKGPGDLPMKSQLLKVPGPVKSKVFCTFHPNFSRTISNDRYLGEFPGMWTWKSWILGYVNDW